MAPVTPLDSRLATALSDRYRIERPLGAGGMATVYLATDLKHDREVALKVLRPELGAVLGTERFLAEIKITARLDHPHILTLIDSGEVGGLLYYVLPLVRGESLRDVLNREKQLGLDQALTITKQVASALDFAHRHGVIHRDIKPENILLQEGEAMLADFGIALAVKEAGGNRLTETGLSLGTPQYMSPEQATGDRALDARSDVYSLAAVLYEMLAGEPPVTGSSAQAMIAKLMTERPTHLRVVRPSVPESIDVAVSKALDKTPADRFASAGDFVKALTVPATTGATPTVPVPTAAMPGRKPFAMIAAAAVVVVALLGFVLIQRKGGRPLSTRIALKDRIQATFSGKVWGPVMSGDGKQIAFGTKTCTATGCDWAVEVQDVGATSSRKIFDGATAAYSLEWSPDRRYLLCQMTYQGRFGVYLLNILGGTPRFLTAGPATFYAGGDSLLIGPSATGDKFAVQVMGINGSAADSVMVPGPGILSSLVAIPGSSRFVAMVVQKGQGLWQIIDRQGHVTDHLLNSCTCGGVASHDAIWMQRAGEGASEAIVRVALDQSTGKLAAEQDTAYYGAFTGVSVTTDGTQLMVDDGAESYAVLTGTVADMLKGKFAATPLMQASSPIDAKVSTDGNRLLIIRSIPAGSGLTETRLSVRPFDGGNESPIPVSGRFRTANWTDSVTISLVTMDRGQTHLSQVDVRTGQVRNRLDVPDSTLYDGSPIPNGWVWTSSAGDRVVVSEGGKERSIPKPDWMIGIVSTRPSIDGKSLAYFGYGLGQDSVRFEVLPVAGGPAVPWFTVFAERSAFGWRTDGSMSVAVWSGQETVVLYQVRGPNQVTRLGVIPHSVGRVSVDGSAQRMSLAWSDRQGDAWLYKVTKQ